MATTVIHSVELFDGHTTRSNATVVFDSGSGKIKSVSTGSSNPQYPSGATVIDGSGHSLLPGLIESHMHCHPLHLPPGANVNDILRSPLKSGVTTVCDMHSDLEYVNDLRKAIADELAQAKQSSTKVSLSDLKSSILGATIEGGWPKPIVLSSHPSEDVRVAASAPSASWLCG
jgi:dihydroorotase-like cyclic amidohydrolase